MLTIDFDQLETIDDWTNALRAIIEEGKSAVQNNDSNRRLQVQTLLTEFIKHIPAFALPLADIARKTAHDIFINQVDSSLAALASRDAELNKQVETLKGVTATANKSAKNIQFENVISALDKAKSAADILKKAEEALAQPDQNLLNKIKALNIAIEELAKLAKPAG